MQAVGCKGSIFRRCWFGHFAMRSFSKQRKGSKGRASAACIALRNTPQLLFFSLSHDISHHTFQSAGHISIFMIASPSFQQSKLHHLLLHAAFHPPSQAFIHQNPVSHLHAPKSLLHNHSSPFRPNHPQKKVHAHHMHASCTTTNPPLPPFLSHPHKKPTIVGRENHRSCRPSTGLPHLSPPPRPQRARGNKKKKELVESKQASKQASILPKPFFAGKKNSRDGYVCSTVRAGREGPGKFGLGG